MHTEFRYSIFFSWELLIYLKLTNEFSFGYDLINVSKILTTNQNFAGN